MKITFIIFIIFCSFISPSYATEPVDLIDFGLPSGNLWAMNNIGAENPWNLGDYFAWGETIPKSDYSWKTYKYCNGMWNGMTKYGKGDKYCAKAFSDNFRNLEPADDVTFITYGDSYLIPTYEDWFELYNNCYMQWTDNYNDTGTQGCIIYRAKKNEDKGGFGKTPSTYSLADTHIFLPAGGYMDGTTRKFNGTHSVYWSSSVSDICSNNGKSCVFYEDGVAYSGESRCEGLLVRAIKKLPTKKFE